MSFENFAEQFNQTQWQIWVIPLAGLFCAGLVLLGGKLLVGSRARRPPDSAPQIDVSNPYQNLATPKRRRSPRGKGTPVRVLLSDAEAKLEPYSGWVVNRSMGGLCITVNSPITVGSLLSVRPAKDLMNDTWYQIEVKHCRKTDSAWEIGCEFHGRCNGNLLLIFS